MTILLPHQFFSTHDSEYIFLAHIFGHLVAVGRSCIILKIMQIYHVSCKLQIAIRIRILIVFYL